MIHNVFSIRLPAELIARIRRQAADRGVTRNAWTGYLIERGLCAEAFEELLLPDERRRQRGSVSPSVPVWRRLLFVAGSAEELLKELNPLLNGSNVAAVGRLAATARDRAEAQTKQLLGELDA